MSGPLQDGSHSLVQCTKVTALLTSSKFAAFVVTLSPFQPTSFRGLQTERWRETETGERRERARETETERGEREDRERDRYRDREERDPCVPTALSHSHLNAPHRTYLFTVAHRFLQCRVPSFPRIHCSLSPPFCAEFPLLSPWVQISFPCHLSVEFFLSLPHPVRSSLSLPFPLPLDAVPSLTSGTKFPPSPISRSLRCRVPSLLQAQSSLSPSGTQTGSLSLSLS